MQKLGPYYIGSITIKGLRDWILDSGLTEEDTVLLNTHTFEELALYHREYYGTALPEPYSLVGVLITDATDIEVPKDRVLVLKGDDRAERYIPEEPSDDGSPIFRCGWCGNVVDEDGSLLSASERSRLISVLQQREGAGNVRRVHGDCCPNRDR